MQLNFQIFRLILVFFVVLYLQPIEYARASLLVLPNYSTNSQVPNAAEGMFVGVGRDQTVYGSSEFPPYPIVIYEIQWRPDIYVGAAIADCTISNIQIEMSTTTNSADHLSSVFSQNTGTNGIVVFSGALDLKTSFQTLSNGTMAFDMNARLQTPFTYDPSKGNLLIDVRDYTGGTANLYDNSTDNGLDTVSRIFSSDVNATTAGATDTGGGAIQITYTPLSEPLEIIVQPTNQTVWAGGSATFLVTTIGEPPLNYQWFFNSLTNPIIGATNDSLILADVQTNQNGIYFVQVSGASASVLSSNALLTVTILPIINSQPVNQTALPGEAATFTVTASSGMSLSYQWYFNNTSAIAGATNAALTVTNTQANRIGFYSVQISNVYGSVISSNASLTLGIIVPNYSATNQFHGPDGSFNSITRQDTVWAASEFPPYPIMISEIRLRPDIDAGGPIAVTLPNTQFSLSTTQAKPDQLSSTISQNIGTNNTLVFNGALSISTSFSTLPNGTKAFDFRIPFQIPFFYDPSQGNLLLDFRNFNGCMPNVGNFMNIAGASDGTSRIYTGDPNGTTASGDTGGYVVEIAYSPAPISPIITSEPTNRSVAVGVSTIFAVTVFAAPPLSYQWFVNDFDHPIDSATNSSLTLTNVQTNQAGSYFVQVTGPYGSTQSSPALLTVTTLPVINSQPTNQTVFPGEAATFSVTASSGLPLSYQWYFNNTSPVTGATNAELIVTNVQGEEIGFYSVQVSNAYGSITSPNAFLTLGLIVPNYSATNQYHGSDGSFNSVTRQDTVWAASEFPPYPIVINEIRFRPDIDAGGPISITLPNAQFSFSTTQAEPDQLSSTISQNIGTNNTLVFSGALSISTSFSTLPNGTKAFDFRIPLQTPFLYNPAQGNLLLDFRNFNGCTPAVGNFMNLAGVTDGTSRIYTSDPNGATAFGDTGGYVLEVAYSPAPVAPSLTSQPTNRLVAAGIDTTIAVTVFGAGPLTYQWFFNDFDHPLDAATNSSLTLTSVQTNESGSYFVQVTGAYGAVQSTPALLSVVPAPVITSQPVSQTVTLGGIATFAVAAQGGTPLSYQWYFNITNSMSGATNASLILTNVQANQVGLYSVQVSNMYGATNSFNVDLGIGLIVPNYALTFQPNNLENTFVSALRIQTVYGSNQFPAYPILISELRWRPNISVGGPLTDNIPNIQFNLSTTLTNVDHLNSNFAKNSGTNDTMVFSGPLVLLTSFVTLSNGTKAFDISVPLQTPFVYDSAKGNLLVDVRNFSGGSAGLYTSGLTTVTDTVSRTFANGGSATTASGFDSEGGALQLIFTPAPLPPTISSQPTNRSVIIGGTTSFSVVAGPPPVTYQWFYNTNTLLSDATNASLTLTNVQLGQSGTYSVIVSNSYGPTTSAFAVLTATYPPVNVVIGGTNAMGGNSFTIPVLIAANGNENSLSFSLSFDTQQVTYASVDLGSGAADGLLIPNTSQTASGRIGVTMQLPLGETFAPGTQEVVRVTFGSAIVSGTPVVTPINFTNQPINRVVFDAQGGKLATNFINGSVTLALSDFEGDVTPRQTGDHNLDIFDWTQVGRFVAGLDVITNASEFQRADVAPKSTSGDGQLKVTDWVQAARYGGVIDASTVVGGPTAPVLPTILTGGPRTVNIAGGTGVKGLNITVPIILQSQGNENGIGFSVNFDPTVLKYVSTAKGSADSSSSLLVNTNQAASGTVGVLVALQAGSSFTNGAQEEIAKLTFTALNSVSNGALAFVNGPVLLSVSDPLANELAANYSNGAVTINLPPILTAGFSGSNATLSWPIWATGFNVQATGDLLNQGWTNVGYTAQTNGNNIIITIPPPAQGGYFRLQHP
jgi:hypothetical protein